MFKSFRVQNFRCFEDLKIDSFARVNLIAGKNNVGKTSLLEAMFIHSGAYNPKLVLIVNALRGIEKYEHRPGLLEEAPWDSIFYNFDNSKEIRLSGKSSNIFRVLKLKVINELSALPKGIKAPPDNDANISNGIVSSSEKPQVLRLNSKEGKNKAKQYYMTLGKEGFEYKPPSPNPPFETVFIGGFSSTKEQVSVDRFSQIIARKRHDDILDVLRIIEPRLESITILPTAGVNVIHGDIGLPKLMPLPLMGGGIARVLEIFLHIMSAKDGVLLIDEIENMLHHSTLLKVWQKVAELAREFNTQVIASTHSLECIVSAHKAFSESNKYDFLLHRLDRIDDKIDVVTYDQESLDSAIDFDMEIR